jgi:hypothetical protein
MGHDHEKKKHHKDDDTKTKKTEQGDDQGKLSDAMKNKDDDNEMTPGLGDPSKAAKDVKGQVIAATDQDGMAKIIINRGSDDGITSTELDAYLIGSDNQKYSVAIDKVTASETFASVQTSAYNIKNGDMMVVINPSAPKKEHKKKHHHHHG